MGFESDYMKLRKKRLEEEKKKKANTKTTKTTAETTSGGGFSADEYYKLRNERLTTQAKTQTTAQNNAIAPIKTTVTNDTQKRTWFQKGALEDGVTLKNVGKTALGTHTDAKENVWSAILGMGEKAVDFLAMLGQANAEGQLNEAAQGELLYKAVTGQNADGTLNKYEEMKKEGRETTAKFIKKDLYDEEKIAKKIISDPVKKFTGVDAETDSVYGEKTDALIQSAAQLAATAGLQAVGVPWWMTTGATTFGTEAESALNQGATFEQAGASAFITAGAEILSEKLTGGISFGGKSFIPDEMFSKFLGRTIASKTARTLAKLGVDASGEGFEEIFSNAISSVGQKLTYNKDKDISAKELLFSEETFESFVGGFVLGGVSSGSKILNKNIDYATGLTNNEKKIVDKVYKDAIEQKEEKNGKKLTQKEKKELYDNVLEQMERGEFSTDTIEEVLGGYTYKSYKDVIDKETADLQELAELYEGDELKQQVDDYLANSKRNKIGSQLSNEVFELVKGSKLSNSYLEKSKRSKTFEADLSQYEEKYHDTIKRAVDSGILNDTRRTHEFVDLIAKLSADKGVVFDFANNEKIAQSRYAVKGRTVNGYVDENNNVVLNIDSAKALNSTVGHEITHILEGTDLYDTFKDVAIEYAKSHKATNSKFTNEYFERLDNAIQLYKDIDSYKGKDGYEKIKREVVADLVGDYIFTDEAFIRKLSTEHRNIFEKVYDEIKYLCKIATAGSKEARQLEKVKKVFEDVYRGTTTTESAKNSYSLGKYSDAQINNWANSKKIVVYQNDAQLLQFVRDAISDKNSAKKMYFGVIDGDLAERIKTDANLDFEGKNAVLRAGNVRKVLLHDHGDVLAEQNRGQIAVTEEDFLAIKDIFGEPDNIRNEPDGYNGKPAATFEKVIGPKKYTMFVVDSGGSLDIFVQTMFIHKQKGSIANVSNANALNSTSETTVGTAPKESVAQKESDVNTKYSLSAEQQEYFKNSLDDTIENVEKILYDSNNPLAVVNRAKTKNNSSIKWVYKTEIFSVTENKLFHEKISKINQGSQAFEKNFRGEYMLPIENKIIFTNGDYDYPYIREIIEVLTEYQTEFEEIRGRIFDVEKGKSSKQDAVQFCEQMYGKGNIVTYTSGNDGVYDWQNGKRKGKTRRTVVRNYLNKQYRTGNDKQIKKTKVDLNESTFFDGDDNQYSLSDSLSAENEQLNTYGNYKIYGKDIRILLVAVKIAYYLMSKCRCGKGYFKRLGASKKCNKK